MVSRSISRSCSQDENLFIAAKAFAAGVILATGFVHMLPDGSKNLSNSCLPKNPWSKFPFSRFIAMMATLLTFMLDFVETQLYERKAEKMRRKEGGHNDELGLDGSLDSASAAGILPADRSPREVLGTLCAVVLGRRVLSGCVHMVMGMMQVMDMWLMFMVTDICCTLRVTISCCALSSVARCCLLRLAAACCFVMSAPMSSLPSPKLV